MEDLEVRHAWKFKSQNCRGCISRNLLYYNFACTRTPNAWNEKEKALHSDTHGKLYTKTSRCM